MTSDAKKPEHPDLAARQRAVVAALTGTGPVPDAFDSAHLDTARRALLRKRARELHFVWPLLAAALGKELPALFAEFAHHRPTRGARADGHDFAIWLRKRGELPGVGAFELAETRVHWMFSDAEPPRPHPGRFAVEPFPGGRLVRVGRRVHVLGRLRTD